MFKQTIIAVAAIGMLAAASANAAAAPGPGFGPGFGSGPGVGHGPGPGFGPGVGYGPGPGFPHGGIRFGGPGWHVGIGAPALPPFARPHRVCEPVFQRVTWWQWGRPYSRVIKVGENCRWVNRRPAHPPVWGPFR
jgi:hypothetical protein